IAEDLQQPVGKVLTSTQQISERDLQSALLAQSMLAQGMIDDQMATDALKIAARENITFGAALDMMQAISQRRCVEGDLVELLTTSGMTTIAYVEEARRLGVENHLPLGNNLMSLKLILASHLNYAFECLNLVNEGRITKATAVKALAEINQNNIDLASALKKL